MAVEPLSLLLLRSAMERLTEAVVVVDSSGRLVYGNDAGRRVWGLGECAIGEPAEIRTEARLPDGSSLSPDDLPLTRALRGDVLRDVALVIVSPDGLPLETLSSADPVRDEHGGIVGAVVVTQDLTKRASEKQSLEPNLASSRAETRRAEAGERAAREELRIARESLVSALSQLDETRTRLKAIGESFLFGIWLADSEGKMILTGPSLLEMIGKTADEVGDLGWMAGLVPDERERTLAEWRECAASGCLWDRDCHVRGADGIQHTVLSRGAPLRDQSGRVNTWAGINVDLTKIEQTRNRINDARIYAEGIVSTVREPLVVLTEDHRVSSANASFYRTFGVDPKETVGQSLYDLGDRQWDIPSLRALLEDVLAKDRSFEDFTVEHDFPRIGHKIMLLNARPVLQEGNHVRLILLAIEDVTAFRDAQRLREDYVSIVSHDLRNPLANVISFVELLKRALATQGLQTEAANAEAALTNARRMNSMIQDLVETSRLESGRIELRKHPFSLYGLVADTIDLIGPNEDRERIELVSDDSAVVVDADPDRIERAVTNLLTNALKYSDPSSRVTVRVRQTDGQGVVSVTDQGVGISPEELPKVFERYYRAGRTKKTEGLGLGLYTTRLTVEAHGGRVWAESELGKGSTFYLALPTS